MKPVISVIIPAYNAESTILETIESVQNQTFTDFEIIVVNDGSSDQTSEILQGLQDQRIKVFTYQNGGLPTARNRGILQSKGEFITFLDADDLWSPNKLMSQLAALQNHSKAGLSYSWTYFMDEQSGSRLIQPGDPVYWQGDVYSALLINNFIASGSNVLIRREVIEDIGYFDPDLKSCEDWDYWIRIAARYPFALVPEHQIFYRRSSGAMSSKVERMKYSCLTVLDKAFRTAPSNLQPLKRKSLAWVHQYCAELDFRYGTSLDHINRGGASLWQSICFQPALLFQKHTLNLFKWFIKKQLMYLKT